MSPEVARLRPAIGRSQRLLLGWERKSQKASQNGAFDPKPNIAWRATNAPLRREQCGFGTQPLFLAKSLRHKSLDLFERRNNQGRSFHGFFRQNRARHSDGLIKFHSSRHTSDGEFPKPCQRPFYPTGRQCRYQDAIANRFVEALDATSLTHSRADDSKIEALDGADIAEKYLAFV